MRVSRHYLMVGDRRVHYRAAGSGPPLLMVHQSPRSSAEFDALIRQWSGHFTCIAPDTPGFGQSDPLPVRADGSDPDIADFADAIAQFAAALGIGRTAAYGFHSGGIILMTALRRHPSLFTGMAIGGYAVWTDAERAQFDAHYLPPFRPTAYGDHLVWLWNRMLEQSWFFPWYDVRSEARMAVAHADIGRVHAAVMDMLDSGDAYRVGYGAVLRAPRDIPPADADVPPVLITAYDGDPLQAHLARLGPLPAGWRAQAVDSPAAHHAISLDFLRQLPGAPCPSLPGSGPSGFFPVSTEGFDGLIHVDGDRVDLPGHGLSDAWPGPAPTDWSPWQAVIDRLSDDYHITTMLPPLPVGDADLLFPDLTPDRFGSHLIRAWGMARARALFAPWYAVQADTALPVDPTRLTPDALARDARDILRAHAAKAFHIARTGG